MGGCRRWDSCGPRVGNSFAFLVLQGIALEMGAAAGGGDGNPGNIG